MASPGKSPQISIQRRETRVCFQPNHLRLPLSTLTAVSVSQASLWASLSQPFPCTSPSISHMFSSLSIPVTGADLWLPPLFLYRSIYCPEWQIITSQVTAVYSRSWEVVKVGFFFFLVHRVFQDLLKFSEPNIPCESAELLVMSFFLWCCQCCYNPHPLQPSFMWLEGRWGESACFSVLTTVITVGQASDCSH